MHRRRNMNFYGFLPCLLAALLFWASCAPANVAESRLNPWAALCQNPEKLSMREKVMLADSVFTSLARGELKAAEQDSLLLTLPLIFDASGYIILRKKDSAEVSYTPEVFLHRLCVLDSQNIKLVNFSLTEYDDIRRQKTIDGEIFMAYIFNYAECTGFDEAGKPLPKKLFETQFSIRPPDTTLKSYNRIFMMRYAEM